MEQTDLLSAADDLPESAKAFALAHWNPGTLEIPKDPRVGAGSLTRTQYLRNRTADGMVWYECFLSGQRFALPVGTPPPVLRYDLPDTPGEDFVCTREINPEIVQTGPEKLREWIDLAIQDKLAEVEDLMIDALELAAILRLEIRPEWPAVWTTTNP